MSNPPASSSSSSFTFPNGLESPRPLAPASGLSRQDCERDLEQRLARFERMLRQRNAETDPADLRLERADGDDGGSGAGPGEADAPTDPAGDLVVLFDPVADLDDLASYLPEGPPAHRLEVLCELIRSHLEWCHEHLPVSLCPQVEADYLARFPELADKPGLVAAVRFEEQRQRLRRGEPPTPPPRMPTAPDPNLTPNPHPTAAAAGAAGLPWCLTPGDSPGDRSSRSVGDVATAYLLHLRRQSQRDREPRPTPDAAGLARGEPPRTVAVGEAMQRNLLDSRSGGLDPRDRDALALFERLDREAPHLARRIAEAAAALDRLRPGTQLIRGFHLLEQIGRGAFGRVFLARQNRHDLAFRHVVLKVVASECERGEASALARLHHTHIVPIHSVHTAGPLLVICMQYLGRHTLDMVIAARHRAPGRSRKNPAWSGTAAGAAGLDPPTPCWADPSTSWAGGGGSRGEPGRSSWWRRKPGGSTAALGTGSDSSSSLGGSSLNLSSSERRRLKAERRLRTIARLAHRLSDLDQACWFALKLVRALKFAHNRGIQHGDLKPANILVSNHGEPLLLDFNLSRRLRAAVGLEMDRLGGTLPYMAPEALEALAARHPLPPDPRLDLYSLGIVLYELFTGRPPYDTPDGPPAEVVARMIRERRATRPRARIHNPEISPGLEAILLRCLEPRPEDRYQTAGQLAIDLKRHLKHWPLKYAVNPSKRETLGKAIRRRPLVFASIVGILLFIPLVSAYVQKRIDYVVAEGNRNVLEQISATLVVADRFDRIEQEASQLDQAVRGGLVRVLRVGEPARSLAARDLANRLGGQALRLARELLEFERHRDDFQSHHLLLRLLESEHPAAVAPTPAPAPATAGVPTAGDPAPNPPAPAPPSIVERLRSSALHPAHRGRCERLRIVLARALTRLALVADHAASSPPPSLAESPSRAEETHPAELARTADEALDLAHELFAPHQPAAAQLAQRLIPLLDQTRHRHSGSRGQVQREAPAPLATAFGRPGLFWETPNLAVRDQLELDPVLARAVTEDPRLDHLLVLHAGLQGRLGEEMVRIRAQAAAEATRAALDPDPVPHLVSVLCDRAAGDFPRARARWETIQTRLLRPLQPERFAVVASHGPQEERAWPPGLEDLVWLQADLHRRAADPVQACATYRMLQRLRPDDPAVHLGLAESLVALLETPRPDRALRAWARLRLPDLHPVPSPPGGAGVGPDRLVGSSPVQVEPSLVDLAQVTLAEARRELALVQDARDSERPRLILVRDRLERFERALNRDPHLFTVALTTDSDLPPGLTAMEAQPGGGPAGWPKPNAGQDNSDLHAIVRMALHLPIHFGAGDDRDPWEGPPLNLAQIDDLLAALERSRQLDAEHLDLRPLAQALARRIPHAPPSPAAAAGGDPATPPPPEPLVLQARADRLITSDAATLHRFRDRLEHSPDEIHALDLLIELTLSVNVNGPQTDPLRLQAVLPRLRAWARRLSQLAPSHPRLNQVRPLIEADF